MFRKSSYSMGSGDCAEVDVGPLVAVRDSKDPAGPVLAFTRREWAVFIARVKAGR